jgi:hypothetical protein
MSCYAPFLLHKKIVKQPIICEADSEFIFFFTQNKKDITNLCSLQIDSIFIMKIYYVKICC